MHIKIGRWNQISTLRQHLEKDLDSYYPTALHPEHSISLFISLSVLKGVYTLEIGIKISADIITMLLNRIVWKTS